MIAVKVLILWAVTLAVIILAVCSTYCLLGSWIGDCTWFGGGYLLSSPVVPWRGCSEGWVKDVDHWKVLGMGVKNHLAAACDRTEWPHVKL